MSAKPARSGCDESTAPMHGGVTARTLSTVKPVTVKEGSVAVELGSGSVIGGLGSEVVIGGLGSEVVIGGLGSVVVGLGEGSVGVGIGAGTVGVGSGTPDVGTGSGSVGVGAGSVGAGASEGEHVGVGSVRDISMPFSNETALLTWAEDAGSSAAADGAVAREPVRANPVARLHIVVTIRALE
ncbi:hypothetical protein LJ754_11190 [Arthrobacter sp. zg-Y40]|uniref:hypothetical protein n=1 Tax=Arthrobacter sp. zg-Y40 TaxID=2886939 RepID=UPI001D148998|nr:hypothetical protein [Arthrobacter sp. zg-Y40]MCC3279715.1 hypothetical protein [Arthrobacter sp. zg-Y40]